MATILITGTSKGIGYEATLLLARAGHHVIATMRNPGACDLEKVVDEEQLPVRVLPMDVDDDASVAAVFDEVGESVDALVNNAGIYSINAIEDESFDQIRRVLRRGGRLGFYEICAGSVGPIHLPVPWASDPSINFLTEPGEARRMLSAAGFRKLLWRDVTAPSLKWFQEMMASSAQRPADAPPPLGLNLIMGGTTREKVANITRNLAEDRIRVVQGVLELVD